MAGLEKRPGQRLSARSYSEAMREVAANRVMPIPGATLFSRSSQTLMSSDADEAQAVYVTRVADDHLVGRLAIYVNGGWTTRYDPTDPDAWKVRGQPWPGYVLSDFLPYVIVDEANPRPDERTCTLMPGDLFMPPGGGTTAAAWGGKVIDVNLHKQMAIVAPMKQNIDPTNEDQWRSSSSFDAEAAKCVWIMGYTGVHVGQPALVFEGANMPVPWMMAAWNITGPNMDRFCRPASLIAPIPPVDCASFPDDPICQEGACCEEGRPCRLTLAAFCQAKNQTFIPGFDCDCTQPDAPQECCGIMPCCFPYDPCVMLAASDCIAQGGTPVQAANCVEANCEGQQGCCLAFSVTTQQWSTLPNIGDEASCAAENTPDIITQWMDCACTYVHFIQGIPECPP